MRIDRLKRLNDFLDRLNRGELDFSDQGTQDGDHISIPLRRFPDLDDSDEEQPSQ